MRCLCVCHVVTPHLSPILGHIASSPGNELILALDRNRKGTEIAGARKVRFKRPEIRKPPQTLLDHWQAAVQCGRCALQSFATIAESGFKPDVVMQATMSGASLCLREAFPEAFMVTYLERPHGHSDAETGFRRRMQSIQALESDLTYEFGQGHPVERKLRAWVKPGPLSVNTGFFRPLDAREQPPEGGCPEVIFSLKGLDPALSELWFGAALDYARRFGKKVLMLLPGMEALRKAEALLALDASAGSFAACACNLSDADAVRLFNLAKLLVWPGQGIAPELLQAMSCGTAIMGPAHGSFLVPDENCLSLPEQDIPAKLHRAQCERETLARLGRLARDTILENFAADKVIPVHLGEIYEAMEKRKAV